MESAYINEGLLSYDVTLASLGLTTAHWPWTCMNELLVPAQKGLLQCELPVPELPNVHGVQPLNSTLEFHGEILERLDLVVIMSSLIVLKNIAH